VRAPAREPRMVLREKKSPAPASSNAGLGKKKGEAFAPPSYFLITPK